MKKAKSLYSGKSDPEEKNNFLGWFKSIFVDPFSKKDFVEKWTSAPISIRFRCTNKCNENCSRCFERSGPECDLNILPHNDARFYFDRMKEKISQVVWTGGEWSLIYDSDPDYMLKMFDGMDLSKARGYVVQTNCRWVFGENRDKILADLREIQNKLGRVGKVLKLDMSVDRYRSQRSLQGVQELIRTIVLDGGFKSTKLRIQSCALDRQMTEREVLRKDYFQGCGIDLDFEQRNWLWPRFQVCHANGVRIVIHEENPTLRIGRAADNNFGYKIFDPEGQCDGMADDDREMSLVFREDKMAKWHNYYDWDVMVPYKDDDGNNKPVEQVKSELINIAWRKRMNMELLSMIPFINLLFVMYVKFMIRKTWNENSKELKFVGFLTDSGDGLPNGRRK